MTLSEELLHYYGRLDRPSENRRLPLISLPDERKPSFGVVMVKGAVFLTGLIAGLAYIWSHT